MIKNKYLFYVIILILILVNILIIVKYFNKGDALEKAIESNKSIKEQYKLLSKSMDYMVAITVQTEGKIINTSVIDSMDLDSKVILRLDTKSCQPCINKIQYSLHKVKDKIRNKIIIIGTFTTKSEYEYYKLNFFKEFIVIDLEDVILTNNVIEKNKQPYFFTIDNNNKIRNVFVPDKNFLFLTDTYLKNITACISVQ